jgi:hypothetical protein
MDYRGLSVIGLWVGTFSISALFLRFDFHANFIMILIFTAIALTVYIVRLDSGATDEFEKFADQLDALSGRLSAIEGNVEEINKLLEE